VREPMQMRVDQAGAATADQQRLEGTITADCGQVVGMQQRRPAWMYLAVQRDNYTRHGDKA
jgi:hypothetical protein